MTVHGNVDGLAHGFTQIRIAPGHPSQLIAIERRGEPARGYADRAVDADLERREALGRGFHLRGPFAALADVLNVPGPM